MTSRDAERRIVYENGNHLPIGISSRINLQPTRSLYDFRSKVMAATMIFMVLLCVWRWSWYFKIIWFLWIHHVPMHDWCKFRRDMFINSGDIAHWNMEKLPILYNGNFSLPWKRTEYRIQNTEFISHMYIHVMHYNNNNNYRKISWLYTCIYTNTYIYIYACTYKYIHTHTYTHTYIHTFLTEHTCFYMRGLV